MKKKVAMEAVGCIIAENWVPKWESWLKRVLIISFIIHLSVVPTPTFVVNGRLVTGLPNVKAELEKLLKI